MAEPLASPLSRRLALAGLAVAVGAGTWAWTQRSPLPTLTPRRVGDLVYLEASARVVMDPLSIGVASQEPEVLPPVVSRAELEDPSTAPTLGDAGPAVVAFLDYRCPACRRHTRPLLDGARNGRLRLVSRDWPILGPASTLGARAAVAAARQDGYWALHEALMTTSFVPNPGLVEDIAGRAALDVAQLATDMSAPGVDRQLAWQGGLACVLGARGTPTYVIDGVVMSGGYDVDVLLRLAAQHRLA